LTKTFNDLPQVIAELRDEVSGMKAHSYLYVYLRDKEWMKAM